MAAVWSANAARWRGVEPAAGCTVRASAGSADKRVARRVASPATAASKTSRGGLVWSSARRTALLLGLTNVSWSGFRVNAATRIAEAPFDVCAPASAGSSARMESTVSESPAPIAVKSSSEV
jgi:hypothetical protein